MNEMKKILIVGLGNPGGKYQKVRHNFGFMAVDEFSAKCKVQSLPAGKAGAKWENNKKLKSEILHIDSTLSPFHCALILVKPQTYMNNSGMAVKLVADYYKVLPEDIIIVHDDLDLPLGKIKVRLGGAAAGHHGVEDIIKVLGTDKFIRVRLGIGNLRTKSSEHGDIHVDTSHFVLEPFMANEKSKVKHTLKEAIEAIDLLLKDGLQKAQNQFN